MTFNTSTSEYVVRSIAADARQFFAKKLQSIASVDPVPGHSDMFILRLMTPAKDARRLGNVA